MIRIFGVSTSRTLRVHWAMKEAGIEYETEEMAVRPQLDRLMDVMKKQDVIIKNKQAEGDNSAC